jgi:rare lipoprotein A
MIIYSCRTSMSTLLTLLTLLVLAGCASSPTGSRSSDPGARQGSTLPAAGSGRGGYYKDDGPGDNTPANLLFTPDAVPRVEPYLSGTKRPYVIFGKTYTPITHDLPFSERGTGSWYGKKFHGLPTASGEPYDMYKMTAAHPTLPIPSYVRLTSVSSGKQVILRVNDRGPFHDGRIVDVSYVAALKLGFLESGSHELDLERLLPEEIEQMAHNRAAQPPQATMLAASTRPAPAPASVAAAMFGQQVLPASAEPGLPSAGSGFYLQFGAFSQALNAQQEKARLAPYANRLGAIVVVKAGQWHRLYGGPFQSRADALQAAAALPLSLKPLVVQR